MRLICFYFCFFLLSSFVTDAKPSSVKVPDAIIQSKPYIWKIHDKMNQVSGTTFAVGPHLAVTAFHNLTTAQVQGNPAHNMILSQEGNPSVEINGIVSVSSLYDLAIVETKQRMDSYFHLEDKAPLNDKNIFIPADLFQGFTNIQNTGPVFYKDSQSLVFPTNVDDASGSSGSPALNKEGQIVGVSVTGYSQSIMITTFNPLNAFIKRELGSVCNKFSSFKVCVEEDIKHLKMLAEQGDAFAQYRLAKMYKEGTGIPENKFQAFVSMKNSAEQGYIPAQIYLSLYYYDGFGVEQDSKKAFYWFQQAAKKGYPVAQFMLGYIYELGDGVKQDFEKAFYWYQQSINRGYVPALSEQAEMYARGRGGITKNPLKALEMQKQAASMGSVSALAYLGDMYREGLGVEQNLKKALEFYYKAAVQGDKPSYNKLKYYQNQSSGRCENSFI